MRRILRCGTARVLKKWNPNTNSSRSISSRANSSPTTLVPRSPLLQMKATAITPPPGGQPYRRRRGYAVELARKTVALGKQADHSLPFSSIINSIAVGHILELKQDKMVWEVREDQTVIDAIRVMCEKNSGSVVVYGCETQLPVGILSRIDCMRKLVLKNQFARETPISKVMATEVACVTPAFTLGQCLEILAQSSNLRYLPVVDDIGDPEDGDNRVIGILGQRDVLNWLVRSFLDATDADILDDSDRVSAGDVLNRTGEPLGVCISSDSTVYDALDCMANNNATYTMVNKGEGIEGIFTGTDYLREIILPAKKSKDTKISDVMTKNIVTAPSNYSIVDCISLMLKHDIQHLPIAAWLEAYEEEDGDGSGRKHSVLTMDTERYASSQPLGVITAYDCISYLASQPESPATWG